MTPVSTKKAHELAGVLRVEAADRSFTLYLDVCNAAWASGSTNQEEVQYLSMKCLKSATSCFSRSSEGKSYALRLLWYAIVTQAKAGRITFRALQSCVAGWL